MHADLVKLLDLQAKDSAVVDVDLRLEALQAELGEAIGAFSRQSVERDPAELAAEYDLDERAERSPLLGQDLELAHAPGRVDHAYVAGVVDAEGAVTVTLTT